MAQGRFALVFSAVLTFLTSTGALSQASLSEAMFEGLTPRLVVHISIDQFRADYVTRFRDLYLPAKSGDLLGGFRFLMEDGAWFTNARFTHIPTETGPGHAIQGTGAPPYLNGIVANSWIDPGTGEGVYCCGDPTAKPVGYEGEGRSAKNLLVPTYGDELKRATGGKGKVVAVSLKDRAAILTSGHLTDVALWLEGPNLVSSDAYCKDGKLPQWVQEFNAEKIVDRYRDAVWEKSLPAEAYERAIPTEAAHVGPPASFGATFPHKLDGSDKGFYGNFKLTPWSNDFLVEAAKRAVTAEELGEDLIPDVLIVGLSANDYLGHAFGPNSEEVLELSVLTDHALSDLLNWLNVNVPGGINRCLIVVTADHAVAPLPGESARDGLGGGSVNVGALLKGATAALDERFPGEGDWNLRMGGDWVLYDHAVTKSRGAEAEEVEETIAEYLNEREPVFGAYPRTLFLEGGLPQHEVGRAMEQNFRPERCGDVCLLLKPLYLPGGYAGTGHGSPYTYDQHVPILMRGPGIRKGIFTERASPADIAPTICTVLGIPFPGATVGEPIGIADSDD